GMECDEHGNVWVTGPGGVWVLTPEGVHLGTVATPEVCGSLAWGGEDMHSLFLMTSTTGHAVRTGVGPPPLPGSWPTRSGTTCSTAAPRICRCATSPPARAATAR